ncbi:Uncharacterised protein [Mycobacteroides abscessus subsp. abscessus]|nr:Uncharacterised protein [Mycobacteroides abscessus subsp. abscessus]
MSEQHRVPRAPNGLKTKGQALWKALHEQFDFSQDPHRATLVEDICRTADGGIVNTCGSACFRRPPFQLIRSVPSPPTG